MSMHAFGTAAALQPGGRLCAASPRPPLCQWPRRACSIAAAAGLPRALGATWAPPRGPARRPRYATACQATFSTEEPNGDRAELYERLGVAPGASNDAVKRAYRKLALRLHPDVNRDPAAEVQFRCIQQAYETLTHAGALKGVDGERPDLSHWKSRWQEQMEGLRGRSTDTSSPRVRVRSDFAGASGPGSSVAAFPAATATAAAAAAAGAAADAAAAPAAAATDSNLDRGIVDTHEDVGSQLSGLRARSARRTRKHVRPIHHESAEEREAAQQPARFEDGYQQEVV